MPGPRCRRRCFRRCCGCHVELLDWRRTPCGGTWTPQTQSCRRSEMRSARLVRKCWSFPSVCMWLTWPGTSTTTAPGSWRPSSHGVGVVALAQPRCSGPRRCCQCYGPWPLRDPGCWRSRTSVTVGTSSRSCFSRSSSRGFLSTHRSACSHVVAQLGVMIALPAGIRTAWIVAPPRGTRFEVAPRAARVRSSLGGEPAVTTTTDATASTCPCACTLTR
mmetsp:Transcript_102051/g.288174  ORF Transcript_102051/g.288174 Transcript_102051/m.288174 type:complete len:218 (-) Transcript_102051:14-667(-)